MESESANLASQLPASQAQSNVLEETLLFLFPKAQYRRWRTAVSGGRVPPPGKEGRATETITGTFEDGFRAVAKLVDTGASHYLDLVLLAPDGREAGRDPTTHLRSEATFTTDEKTYRVRFEPLPVPEEGPLEENEDNSRIPFLGTRPPAPGDKDRVYECPSCGWATWRFLLPDAKDLAQRIVPGEPFTDKECPTCRSLMYPRTVSGEETGSPPSTQDTTKNPSSLKDTAAQGIDPFPNVPEKTDMTSMQDFEGAEVGAVIGTSATGHQQIVARAERRRGEAEEKIESLEAATGATFRLVRHGGAQKWDIARPLRPGENEKDKALIKRMQQAIKVGMRREAIQEAISGADDEQDAEKKLQKAVWGSMLDEAHRKIAGRIREMDRGDFIQHLAVEGGIPRLINEIGPSAQAEDPSYFIILGAPLSINAQQEKEQYGNPSEALPWIYDREGFAQWFNDTFAIADNGPDPINSENWREAVSEITAMNFKVHVC